jgi:hypothetical protein
MPQIAIRLSTDDLAALADSYRNAYTAKPLTDDERIALDTASALAADR